MKTDNNLRKSLEEAIEDNQDELDWVNTEKAVTVILDTIISHLPEPHASYRLSPYEIRGYKSAIKDTKLLLTNAREDK